MIAKSRVLVVDDERYICDIVAETLNGKGDCVVVTESDPARALGLLRTHHFDLVLTDLVMGEYSGMQVTELAMTENPDIIVILMTGHPTVENAISALKLGAYDYLVKPFKLDLLQLTVERGLRKQQLARENIHFKEQLALYKVVEAMGSTIHLDTALNQMLRLVIKEFDAEAASILFYNPDGNDKFVLQAIQSPNESGMDRDFLEGKTEHSLAAVRSKQAKTRTISEDDRGQSDPLSHATVRTYLSCPLLAGGQVIGVINLQRESHYQEFSTGELQSLKIIASKAAYAISNSKLYSDLERAYLSTIAAFANAVEARDRYTRGHTERVTYLVELIVRELNWDDKQIMISSMGSSLHDIGKIGVPDSVLNNPGSLSHEEREMMQRHPETGAKMIEGIPFLQPCLPYIYSHHEHWDGNGYPQGLKGEEIPIEGRILAVADTFDAILSHRPYRDAGTIQRAVKELREFSGSQFDPYLVGIFLRVLENNREKIEVIYSATLEPGEIKTELV
ncbi:MAG: response regulator [candidate division Zixibacteria bacterium]|nr:response regulator [candidate division Zixibacteria bacterium]